MTTSIQIVSDLHLEVNNIYDTYEIVPRAPILALLGNIGNVEWGVGKEKLLPWLRIQLKKFTHVMYVPGNHEPFYSSWASIMSTLQTFEENVRQDPSLGEFILLNRKVFRPPGTNIVILGCRLFSKIPREKHSRIMKNLNDTLLVQGWNVLDHNTSHKRDVDWLNQQVAELGTEDVRIVILTHWSPTMDMRLISTKFSESPTCTAAASATDLSSELCWRSGKVKAWAFGHTHYNCDFLVPRSKSGAGPIRILTNQRGYDNRLCLGFKDKLIIDFLTDMSWMDPLSAGTTWGHPVKELGKRS